MVPLIKMSMQLGTQKKWSKKRKRKRSKMGPVVKTKMQLGTLKKWSKTKQIKSLQQIIRYSRISWNRWKLIVPTAPVPNCRVITYLLLISQFGHLWVKFLLLCSKMQEKISAQNLCIFRTYWLRGNKKIYFFVPNEIKFNLCAVF